MHWFHLLKYNLILPSRHFVNIQSHSNSGFLCFIGKGASSRQIERCDLCARSAGHSGGAGSTVSAVRPRARSPPAHASKSVLFLAGGGRR